VRATWTDGTSTLEVSFRGRGNGKSQVVVDHRRLADGAEVTRMKAFWSAALQRLKEIVEA
jgi:hypothetical protein